MKRVVVHIDRLVLNGLRHEDRQAITARVRERLAHEFSDPRALRQLTDAGNTPRLRLGSLALGQGAAQPVKKEAKR